jgi:predicted RND superfamily exporter protein
MLPAHRGELSQVTTDDMQNRIEAGFARFGRGVVRNRWAAAASMLLLAASLIAQLPPHIETAPEDFLVRDDPERVAYLDFQEIFGRQDMIIVAVRPPNVFDLGFLEKLRSLHEEIEDNVAHVAEVQSLINARSTRGEQDELIVEDLLEETPDSAEELAALRERVLANPFYQNTLVSQDGKFTALLVTLDLYAGDADSGDDLSGFDGDSDTSKDENPEGASPDARLAGTEIGAAVDEIQQILLRREAPDFETLLAGSPVLNQEVVRSMQRDLARFVGAMSLAIAALLAFLFRRASGVALPVLAVVLSVGSTIGAMAATDTPISPPSQILPTLLMAVGIGTAIHVLKIFYDAYDNGQSVEDAVAFALAHSGLAIVMTGATTAAGLLSFSVSGMAPMEDLGTFAPLGVILAQLNCLVLLPALLAIVPLRRRPSKSVAAGRLQRSIVRMGAYSARNPIRMVVATLALVAVALPGIARLTFTNDIMSWLPYDAPLKHATEVIDKELRGSITLEVVIDSGRENGVKDPVFLARLDELRTRVSEIRRGDSLFVGRSISIADVVKELHQALHENRPEFYTIPKEERLVAQEILLFENSGADDLEDLVDTRFQKARFTLKVPYVDPLEYGSFIEEVEEIFRSVLPETSQVDTTGMIAMLSQTVARVLSGMLRSYALALAIITPLMILLLANLRTGFASMIPNLSPILLTLGVMGWMGISIDMFTMMIGGVAIGLVVDDTIHFMHGFQRYYAKTGDAHLAVRRTLETTGQALLFTSITLTLGFSVFLLSEMQNLFYFGAFTALAISSAFVLDILVSPALMVLATRRDQHP